jgi:membrane protease YdiL (CAAX protease family)
MSSLPEQFPEEPESPPGAPAAAPDTDQQTADRPQIEPNHPFASEIHSPIPQQDTDTLFKQYLAFHQPSQERIPHFGHLIILGLIAVCALVSAGLLANVGIHFHLYGVTNLQQAGNEIHYTLGTEGLLYILTFGASLLVFPALWHESFFAGIQWRGRAALRRSGYLIAAAAACFVLAMISGSLMPGPADAPIDKVFRAPGAAWILFAFGVTFAPFFEELAFRGFLLPALSTAFDWIAEKTHDQHPHPLGIDGHPQWSMPAMIVAAILTSILFALMHADQTGYSLGPFLLLICVSLVLCWARLSSRSLAASVIVHATYNFLLFSFMFFGTGGFKHLENM